MYSSTQKESRTTTEMDNVLMWHSYTLLYSVKIFTTFTLRKKYFFRRL